MLPAQARGWPATIPVSGAADAWEVVCPDMDAGGSGSGDGSRASSLDGIGSIGMVRDAPEVPVDVVGGIVVVGEKKPCVDGDRGSWTGFGLSSCDKVTSHSMESAERAGDPVHIAGEADAPRTGPPPSPLVLGGSGIDGETPESGRQRMALVAQVADPGTEGVASGSPVVIVSFTKPVMAVLSGVCEPSAFFMQERVFADVIRDQLSCNNTCLFLNSTVMSNPMDLIHMVPAANTPRQKAHWIRCPHPQTRVGVVPQGGRAWTRSL
jgi:hypothetical protein